VRRRGKREIDRGEREKERERKNQLSHLIDWNQGRDAYVMVLRIRTLLVMTMLLLKFVQQRITSS